MKIFKKKKKEKEKKKEEALLLLTCKIELVHACLKSATHRASSRLPLNLAAP
jgi:hypothetical protein